MHTVSASEYPNVDGFARDMAVYDTTEDNLAASVLAAESGRVDASSTDGKSLQSEEQCRKRSWRQLDRQNLEREI